MTIHIEPYTLEQLKLYLNNDVVSNYFWSNFNLTADQVRYQIQTNIDKRKYGIEYYKKRKGIDGVKEQIKQSNKTWYDNNKLRVAALQRCKYINNPVYRQWCQQYQAIYAQNKRNVNRLDRNLGRPRKYNFDSN
jgi:hypothetical protein